MFQQFLTCISTSSLVTEATLSAGWYVSNPGVIKIITLANAPPKKSFSRRISNISTRCIQLKMFFFIINRLLTKLVSSLEKICFLKKMWTLTTLQSMNVVSYNVLESGWWSVTTGEKKRKHNSWKQQVTSSNVNPHNCFRQNILIHCSRFCKTKSCVLIIK